MADHAALHEPGAPPEDLGQPEDDAAGVAALQAKVEQLEDRWRRAVADLDNVRKVVRPRYGEGERQLRPAAVVVATRPG